MSARHQLGRLRAASGVFGCMGNHEIYARSEDYTERRGRELGIEGLHEYTQSKHICTDQTPGGMPLVSSWF